MVGAGIVAKPLRLTLQVREGTGGMVGRGREGVRLVMWQLTNWREEGKRVCLGESSFKYCRCMKVHD